MTAPGFGIQAKITAYNNGVPVARVAVYPGAFMSHTKAQLVENTTNVLVPEIIKALTNPMEESEVTAVARQVVGKDKDIVFTGTIDDVNKYFRDMKWTDGMPIIPPTVDRVEEFLKYTDLSPNETVAVLPIANRNTTPWTIAVNGVIAGCPPEYMPILIAYVKAIAERSAADMYFGSTHSWIPYIWLNGPVARQLGIDHGQGLISETANQVIGRAIGLIIKNLAGFYIKQDRMGSFGYTIPWVLAENERFCNEIGWKPYHTQKGFDKNQSTLTASTSLMWGNNLIPATPDPKIIMQLIAWEVTQKERFACGSGSAFTYRTIMITPSVAQDLARAYTKESLEEDLVKTARRTAFERAFANFYATPGGLPAPTFEENIPKVIKTDKGDKGGLPPWFPEFPGREEIITVPVMQMGKTAILVCGDESRNKAQTMPGGIFIIKEVELPANWDELTSKLGYLPLKEFFF